MNNIFDTHAHYDDSRFEVNLPELLDEMRSNGVEKIITCGAKSGIVFTTFWSNT